MKITFTYLLVFMATMIHGQQVTPEEEMNSVQLEDLAEAEESEPDDDYALQLLQIYRTHKLNLNGPVSELEEFPLLETMHIIHLQAYKKVFGALISVYELQAVPGFTAEVVRKIIPYASVGENLISTKAISDRLRNGTSRQMVRPTLIPQRSDGFIPTDSTGSAFTGSRPALLIRYRYQYKNLLQIGFTGDKDAGEPLISKQRPLPMDFHSFHIFSRDHGLIRSIALGDYSVNLGQGLTHWQSQAFKKSAGVLNVKRQSAVLRPYQSAGEYNFLRGFATTLGRRSWEITGFVSHRKLSANTDESEELGTIITSVLTSGLHRAESELEKRNNIALITLGGNARWFFTGGQVGANLVSYKYSLPIVKRDDPYNYFSLQGKSWQTYSVDYHLTIRNIHVFGEAAGDKKGNNAIIAGLIGSLSAKLDVAFIIRSLDKAYQSPFGNAFTENTLPGNEQGVYTGISIKPSSRWTIDLYFDQFRFPWLKYRVNGPSAGGQYFAQILWKPSKQLELYSRFRVKIRPLNIDTDQEIGVPGDHSLQNWRMHLQCQLTKTILMRNRVEASWFRKPGADVPERGQSIYADIMIKPVGSRYSANMRMQFFETDSYDSRIYAYENDLPSSGATPALFGKGSRIYGNFASKFRIKAFKNSQLSVAVKLATTIYRHPEKVKGSGLSTIHGNQKSDVRLQLLLGSIS